MRHVLRFGASIRGSDVPSVPVRYRAVSGPSGKLAGAYLHPGTAEAWLRLRAGTGFLGLRREVRVYPLSASQPPTPPPDAFELSGGMRVYCHDGYAGELRGIAIDIETGVCSNLLVKVRGDVLAEVERITSPLAPLLDAAGKDVLLPPRWATATKAEAARFGLGGEKTALHLDASAEQVASSTLLRPDADVTGDILKILDANPAVGPFLARLRVEVHDGDVTLRGTLPSARHRASAEQDVWHVPGVFALRNETTIAG
ncbi:MAG TPA: BON domain-containing protein [Ktedonobacterales bacterium]|nr:BON domain-containing protein [Ktedonobacterales bacterium]